MTALIKINLKDYRIQFSVHLAYGAPFLNLHIEWWNNRLFPGVSGGAYL